jgi:methyl coenzyme M reductase subunit C-like uncharacterized protein (methanogenesis marker protein 7)
MATSLNPSLYKIIEKERQAVAVDSAIRSPTIVEKRINNVLEGMTYDDLHNVVVCQR